jgi:hypothetical protein
MLSIMNTTLSIRYAISKTMKIEWQKVPSSKFFMSKAAVLFLSFFVFSLQSIAQVPTTCPSNSLFNLSGLASAKNSYIQLTPNVASAAGQAWSKQTANLTKNFNIKFKSFFGSKDGGNGIAFLFRSPSSASSGGSFDGLMGYSDLAFSLAVEFDTEKDASLVIAEDDGSTRLDDIDIYPNSTSFVTNGRGYYGRLGGTKDLGNIENNVWHNCEIDWNSTTKTLSVKVDGNLVNQITTDIQSYLGTTSAIFGFTASTRQTNIVYV